MADEIVISENITVKKNNLNVSIKPLQNIKHDVPAGYSGAPSPGPVIIGTSEEDISFGDIKPGVVYIENMDSSNYVRIGPKSGGSMVAEQRILPGKNIRMYLDENTTLRAVANSAPVELFIQGIPGYTTSTTTT